MDPEARFDDLVAPLRADVVSGAAALAHTASDVLRRAAVRLQAGSLAELRWGMGEVSRRVLDAQPAMAPLVTLVRDVMGALEQADSLEHGRHAAASAAAAFHAAFERRGGEVARAAARILPAGGTVGTLSSSGTVRALLEAEAEPRGLSVVCFESRPMNEGRLLAAALAKAGADVTYAVDAAIDVLTPDCDLVVFGADSIGDLGVVNKIGSSALTRAARRARVPVYVLADETKLLPRGFPQILDDDRPGAEVWQAPAGVRVWNRYFEVVPTESIDGFVTERGVLSRKEIEEIRGGLELTAGLRAWAAGRQER
jgi:translation initiation factor 2B subunit (eIF-2B alpha/beta/delta family)